MPTPSQLIANITSQYYEAVWAQLGKPDGFQIATGSLNLNDQDTVDAVVDGIPPESLDAAFTTNPINTLSGNYRNIANDLLAPSNVAVALGANYEPQWLEYLAENADTLTFDDPKVLLVQEKALMAKWGALNKIPSSVVSKGQAALVQDLLNPVTTALQLLLAADPGPYGSRPDSTKLPALFATPTNIGFSITDANKSANLSKTWASGKMSVAYDLFSLGGSGAYSKESSKYVTNAFAMTVSMRTVSVPAGPIGYGQEFAIGTKTFPAWFDPAALQYAYTGKNDATVWADPSKWAGFFGPGGTFPRVVGQLYVADSLDIQLTSTASFSAAEFVNIQAAASVGVFPFFSASASGGSSTTATYNADQTVTFRTTSPKGVPLLLGVSVQAVDKYLSSAAVLKAAVAGHVGRALIARGEEPPASGDDTRGPTIIVEGDLHVDTLNLGARAK